MLKEEAAEPLTLSACGALTFSNALGAVVPPLRARPGQGGSGAPSTMLNPKAAEPLTPRTAKVFPQESRGKTSQMD